MATTATNVAARKVVHRSMYVMTVARSDAIYVQLSQGLLVEGE
jgi:hypothetical protein